MRFANNRSVFVFMPRSPPLSLALVCPAARIARFLKCIAVDSRETARWVYRSRRGMWSQTNAAPLSVPPAPEGAGDYELIPLDFGPCSRWEGHWGGPADWKSHWSVCRRRDAPIRDGMFTQMRQSNVIKGVFSKHWPSLSSGGRECVGITQK